MNDKADLDASDEGGEPFLDMNYPPSGEPLYWEEFKAWASANIPEYSLAVIDEQVADPVTAAALQSYRAGTHRNSIRLPRRYARAGGLSRLGVNQPAHRSKDPRANEIAERAYLAGSLRQP